MSTVSEERMKVRVVYTRETNLIWNESIPAYARWLEIKLSESKEFCKIKEGKQ
jgi:hypothetical protein